MRLYIPEIGSRLRLTKDWTFTLHQEYRNESMAKALGFRWARWGDGQAQVTIEKDTILTLDRIYVRSGKSEYSSVTFNLSKKHNKKHKLGGNRFWVKLDDAHKIEFETDETWWDGVSEELRQGHPVVIQPQVSFLGPKVKKGAKVYIRPLPKGALPGPKTEALIIDEGTKIAFLRPAKYSSSLPGVNFEPRERSWNKAIYFDGVRNSARGSTQVDSDKIIGWVEKIS